MSHLRGEGFVVLLDLNRNLALVLGLQAGPPKCFPAVDSRIVLA